MIALSFFQDNLSKQLEMQIDTDKKYLFYPNEIPKKNNLEKYLPNSYPISTRGSSRYFSKPIEWFSSLISELKKAKKFIFLQFFSISPGIMWEEIFNILKLRKNEGVEVRIIYDNLISASKLPKDFSNQLNQIGILCQPYYQKNRLIGILNNHHLHRKVVIIDGKIAFTGGMNIGDEYLNLMKPYGIWQDVGISLTGNSIWNFTVMFLSVWNTLANTKEDYWKYYPKIKKENYSSTYLVYGDNPLNNTRISENLFCSLIDRAKNSIDIYTPYFIPTKKLIQSFIGAKKRKVKVTIILPGIPDKKIIYFLTKQYALFLKDNFFDIYFYHEGFIHGKVLLVDKTIASIGNVNLDYYSLHYNFEYNILLEEESTIKSILKDIKEIKNHSQKWE